MTERSTIQNRGCIGLLKIEGEEPDFSDLEDKKSSYRAWKKGKQRKVVILR